MTRRLPPLNGLRAFEAAARHLSFAKAAEELNVTPAAISHQIKALEDMLGLKLFRRAKRAIWLTEAGQACLPDLQEGFDRLAAAVERLRGQDATGPVNVSTAPSFAAKWLLPRLERFRAEYPDIDVRLDARMELTDFARDDVDLAVRFGGGKYPGLNVELLLCEAVFPVCSPALLQGAHPLRGPDDLRWHTLLHEDLRGYNETYPDWPMWLRAAGVTDIEASRGLHFSSPELLTQAAVAGQGVALGRSVVVAADVEAGRLVQPFELSYPLEQFAYYVVTPPGTEDRPKVAAFCRWLVREAESYREQRPQQGRRLAG